MDTLIVVGLWLVGGVFGAVALALTFFTVKQQTAGVVERFGKFNRIAKPGLNMKIPFIDWVVGRPNLRILELPVKVETKTADNTFVHVVVSVQYFADPKRIYEAFYKLNNPGQQIESYVFDVVRARVPKIKLDAVFEEKDDIADAVKLELQGEMSDFGYVIHKALVTDIDPNAKVKESMNGINAAQRDRIAATEKGEAEKILVVKAAEAEAESKALQGQGIARQRKAIVDGLRESVEAFAEGVEGTTPGDVMNLVLMTQYFDTLKDIGASSETNTILMPHSPGNMSDVMGQIRDTIMTANQVGVPTGKGGGNGKAVHQSNA